MDTLERRLHSCIQRTRRRGQQRKLSGLVNSVSSIGTMVPTPGFYQTTGRKSSSLSQGDNFVNASNMVLPTSSSKVVHGGSFNVSGGNSFCSSHNLCSLLSHSVYTTWMRYSFFFFFNLPPYPKRG